MKEKFLAHAQQIVWAICVAGFCLVLSGKVSAYLLPSEQIIEFMAKNFKEFQTLSIEQTTRFEDLEIEESAVVFEEAVSIKSPDLYSSKVLGKRIVAGSHLDQGYRELLISNEPERLMGLLSGMGIDLEKVSFTRIDGMIAYCIGETEPGEPKILVEKDRFLPLLLTYHIEGKSPPEIVTVRFKDYREVGTGWYPFEIISSSQGRIREINTVRSLQINKLLDSSTLEVLGPISEQGVSPEKKQVPPQDEKLRQLIKTFEEKYSQ